MVLVDNDGFFMIIEDPQISAAEDGVYRAHVTFDGLPDSRGIIQIKDDVMVFASLPVVFLRSLMISKFIGVESGSFGKQYELHGSGDAIKAVLECARDNNFLPSPKPHDPEKSS